MIKRIEGAWYLTSRRLVHTARGIDKRVSMAKAPRSPGWTRRSPSALDDGHYRRSGERPGWPARPAPRPAGPTNCCSVSGYVVAGHIATLDFSFDLAPDGLRRAEARAASRTRRAGSACSARRRWSAAHSAVPRPQARQVARARHRRSPTLRAAFGAVGLRDMRLQTAALHSATAWGSPSNRLPPATLTVE